MHIDVAEVKLNMLLILANKNIIHPNVYYAVQHLLEEY